MIFNLISFIQICIKRNDLISNQLLLRHSAHITHIIIIADSWYKISKIILMVKVRNRSHDDEHCVLVYVCVCVCRSLYTTYRYFGPLSLITHKPDDRKVELNRFVLSSPYHRMREFAFSTPIIHVKEFSCFYIYAP